MLRQDGCQHGLASLQALRPQQNPESTRHLRQVPAGWESDGVLHFIHALPHLLQQDAVPPERRSYVQRSEPRPHNVLVC